MDIEDIDEDMPFELIEHARAASMDILPETSRKKYNGVYKNFKAWQGSYNVKKISTDLILAYFQVLAKKNYKPSSLWAFYSMLKATLKANENVEIGKCPQVSSFLKAKSSGYKPIKAEVFSENEIKKFIDEGDELLWLDVKVACIFGISGACRTDELVRFTVDDITKYDGLFHVKVNQTKTKVSRSFTINGGFATIVQKYIDLRPNRLKQSDRFFVNYQKGKCTIQFMGKNKISNMPRRIAEFLKLPQPERYTGHSFRRTSATILANSGADMETIMRHGAWRNESCAKGYIEDSLTYKARTGEMIRSSILGQMSSSAETSLAKTSTSSAAVDHASKSYLLDQRPSNALFDSLIDDAELVDAVDRASQSYLLDQRPSSALFDSSIDDAELVDAVDRASQSNVVEKRTSRGGHSNIGTTSVATGPSTSVSQSNSNNSTLNAILSHTFKSVQFDNLNNCTFNFYLSKS